VYDGDEDEDMDGGAAGEEVYFNEEKTTPVQPVLDESEFDDHDEEESVKDDKEETEEQKKKRKIKQLKKIERKLLKEKQELEFAEKQKHLTVNGGDSGNQDRPVGTQDSDPKKMDAQDNG
jgi:hypothetical protein